MHVLGTISEAWVEKGRVLGLASLSFDTHTGVYRLDLTPHSPEFKINLVAFAKSCIGKPVRVENPLTFMDTARNPIVYSIGVTP